MAEHRSTAIRLEERLRRAKPGPAFQRACARSEVVLGTAQLPLQLGRHVLIRYLGGGATGRVYEALDTGANQRVALKVFRESTPETRQLLKRESRALSRISHPNLVTFLEARIEPGLCYFAMELIEGDQLMRYLACKPRPMANGLRTLSSDPARVCSAFEQLASALRTLHAAGMVHRDLKPSNVLVTKSGRVVVLDLGLCRSPRTVLTHSTFTGRAVGTPAYMAPEQLNGGTAVPASDCYALGVMLFEALSGELPLTGETLEEIALVRRSACAPRLTDLVVGVPPELDELCQRLLHAEPAARPTSSEVLERLGMSSPAPPSIALEPDEDEPFIGRQAEIEALRAALAASADQCVVLALGGPAGIGKSRLVQWFLRSLAHDYYVILVARCHERESLPYKTIDGLLDALVPFLKRLPPHELERVLPRHLPELVRMFPSLARIDAFAAAERNTPRSDEQEQKQRAAFGLRELFGRIADRYSLVIWIDDLQWGDHDSIALIRQILCSPHAPTCLCIGSLRTEAADLDGLATRFLRLLERDRGSHFDLRAVRLSRLSSAETSALVRRLMPDASSAVVEHVAQESDGSPFLVAQLAEFCLDTRGAVALRPVTLHDLMAERLARLAPSALEVVQLIALAATLVEQRTIVRAAGLPDDTVFHQLRTGRFVRTQGQSERGRVELYHGALAAPILSTLDPPRARVLHARLANALIECDTKDRDHERIAFHLRQAGHDVQAIDHLLVGAERANRVLAHVRAARLYALALQTDATGSRAQEIRVARAEALRKAGRGLDAAQAYLMAAVHEPGEWQCFELRRKAAQEFLLMGQIEEGSALLRELMPKVGLALPRSRWRAIVSLLLRRAFLRIRGIRFPSRAEQQVARSDLARVDTCWLLGQALVMIDPLVGTNLQSQHVLLALQSGEPSRVARALALEAGYASFAGTRAVPWAERLLERARQLSADVNDPLARASTALWAATAAYLVGEPERAVREAQAAERDLREECTGTAYELATCHLIFLGSYSLQGSWLAFGERAQQALDEAIARGNRYQSVGLRVHTNMARLIAGDLEGARQEIQAVRDEWPPAEFLHMQHLAIFVGEARVRIYAGDGVGACDHLEGMWPQVERSMLLRAQMVRVESVSWRARAHALAYAQTGDARYRRAALRHAKGLERERFLGAAGHALLVRGALAVASGHAGRACELWRDAARSYERERLPFYAAVARYEIGRHSQAAFAERLRAQAERVIVAEGVADITATVQLFSGDWQTGSRPIL